MGLLRIVFYLWCGMLLLSCAQQRMPSGGDKDIAAPQIVYADPEPLSTNFSGQRIELEFDEYVTLQGLRDQVLISPPLDVFPDITLRGSKRIVIDFGDEQLRDNTTYTINFGEAIKDNNEGNPLTENVFLFSTGTFIDTLSLNGLIKSAAYDEPCTNCLAMLYPNIADSLVLTTRPHYVSRTDERGMFQIKHLAAGEYRLFGLRDFDSDLSIDADEALAFKHELLSPRPGDSLMHVLRIFKPESKYVGIKSSDWSADGRVLSLVTSGLDSMPVLEPELHDRLLYVEPLGGRNDSLRYWFDGSLEALQELVLDLDGVRDTIRTGRSRAEDLPKAPEIIVMLPHANSQLNVELSSPIMAVMERGITITKDSIPLVWSLSDSLPKGRSTSLSANWEAGASYVLSILPGTFKDIYGQVNDSLQTLLRVPEESSFGILTLDLQLPKSDKIYCIALLDKGNKVIRTISSVESIQWSIAQLSPGDYKIRVYHDLDGDKTWTSGNFPEKIQPEPVFMLEAPISVRANWELEQIIHVRFE